MRGRGGKREGNNVSVLSTKRVKISPTPVLTSEKTFSSFSGKNPGEEHDVLVAKKSFPLSFTSDSKFADLASGKEAEVRRKVKERANFGDADALHRMGCWYDEGNMGFNCDPFQAYQCYMRAACKGNIFGMASAGLALVQGRGVEGGANVVEGMALLDRAAHVGGGSDLVAFWFGLWYSEGSYGLPQNLNWATFWLRKVVNRSCGVEQVNAEMLTEANIRLNKLLSLVNKR